jgi:ribosomal protein S17E
MSATEAISNSSSSYIKYVREEDENVESFQSKFEDFRKVIRNLHNYSSNDTTNDKLKTYLTKLTDTYNSMAKKKDGITDKSLLKQLDSLDSLFEDNAKALKKLGLKMSDGKLEFDDDKFDDDADSEQKTINSLFTGTNSFIDQIYKLMRKIDKSASEAQYVLTPRRYYVPKEQTDSTNSDSASLHFDTYA